MNVVVLIARLLSSAVFAVSAVTKLADQEGTRRAITEFGAPRRFAMLGALLLPAAELGTSAALLWNDTGWWGALASLMLLFVFSVAIAVNIRRGRTPDCHCFGQIYSEPIGPKTLIRNGVIAVPALIVLVAGWNDPGPSALAWLGDLSTVETILAVVSLALAVTLGIALVSLRQLAMRHEELNNSVRVMERLFDARDSATLRHPDHAPSQGLPIGAVAPDFALASSTGREITLTKMLAKGKPILTLFVSPTCGPCKELLPSVPEWTTELEERHSVLTFSRGGEEENAALVKKHRKVEFVFMGASMLAESYRALWTPGAVIISQDGRIASKTAYGIEAIRDLVERLSSHPAELPIITGEKPHHRTVGAAVPEFRAITPDGRGLNRLEIVDGATTVMLFWNPECPHCSAMTADLKHWANHRPPRAPKLVLVRSRSDEVPTESFGAPVVLDVDGSFSRELGSAGTPSAVLVDRAGVIASLVVVGSVEVRALLGMKPAQVSVQTGVAVSGTPK